MLIALFLSASLVAAPKTAAINLAACEFGERHAQAPDELAQYAFLIGNHTIRAWKYDPENQNWGRGYLETEWNGWWALGGFAIADEWFDVQFPGQPDTMGRGINIRMWDAENTRWENMWMHTRTTATTVLHSTVEDGKMVMYQHYPQTETTTRIEFEVHDNGDWTRIAYREDADGGVTPLGKLEAVKQDCSPE